METAIKIAAENQPQPERPLKALNRHIQNFSDRKRPTLSLIGGLIVVFLLTKLIVNQVRPLAVLEFAYLAILCGLAPAYFLRRLIQLENIVDWLAWAGAFGVLLIPYTFIVAGWLDINLVFGHSIWVLYIAGIVGLIALIVFADCEVVHEVVSFKNLDRTDALVYAALIGYTALLTLLTFSQVHPYWDVFTYWGLAAKYVYQYQQLPSAVLDVFTYLKYTAFHPINLAVIYNLYGAVVEQYAAWLNVFINLLAVVLVYNRFTGSSLLKKALILTILILTSFGVYAAAYMFTIYADTLCALIVLVFVLVLINENGLSPQLYSQRTALLLLLSTSLFLIKSLMAVITLLLIAAWLVYDFDFISKRWKDLVRRWDLWVVLAAAAAVHLLRYWYVNYTLQVEHTVAEASIMVPAFTSFFSIIDYAGNLPVFLVRETPYLFGLWLVGMGSLVLQVRNKRLTKKYLAVYLVTLGLFAFYCIAFIVYERSLTSESLVRYTSIVAYLVPLLVSFISVETPTRLARPFTVILCLITVLLFQRTFTSIPRAALYHPVVGSYSALLKNHTDLVEKVLNISGKKARILIADDVAGLFSNMYTPAIYIRYYLMANSVGGHYHSLEASDLIRFVQEYDADYLLLLSYNDTLDNCEKVFSTERNYLVRLKDGFNQDPLKCPFKKKSVFDVTLPQ